MDISKLGTVNINKSCIVYLKKIKLVWDFRNINYKALHDEMCAWEIVRKEIVATLKCCVKYSVNDRKFLNAFEQKN